MHTLNKKIDFSKVYSITSMRKILISLKQLTLTKIVQILNMKNSHSEHEDGEYSHNLYGESTTDIMIQQQLQAIEETQDENQEGKLQTETKHIEHVLQKKVN